jgi:hypothetical protein
MNLRPIEQREIPFASPPSDRMIRLQAALWGIPEDRPTACANMMHQENAQILHN